MKREIQNADETWRNMTFEERFLEGARLFEVECEEMRAGIEAEFPDATEEERERLFQIRFDERWREERESKEAIIRSGLIP